ncbi:MULTISPECIES: LPS assembly lipoprotein LptE [Vibrio]|nr:MULTISPECIES: LPS assembly lipoprotein LptE [Vibrio]MDN3696612.1 LPS assembly lipoprotein LptE [Vibrio cortegadensis]RBW65984.1 luciferase [Vibrionales bacterium C3R12]TKF14986.1 luciferase [Vibrio genomosp. F6]
MRLFSLPSMKISLVVLLTSLVSACGFHLRGEYSIPQELATLSLTSFDQYNELTRDVKDQLILNNITLVTPSNTTPNIHLIDESIDERTLSLYQNSQAAEKELTYKVSYRVTLPTIGSDVFSTTVNRNYLDNPLTALAKSVERDVIESEMRTQAAAQIIRQLARTRTQISEAELKKSRDIATSSLPNSNNQSTSSN